MAPHSSRAAVLLGAVLALLAAAPRPAVAQSVATWESSIAALVTPKASGQTVRQYARVAVGGAQIRLRFSNATGTKPLAIADAHVALAGSAPGTVDPASDHAVTFAGGAAVTVAPGADVVSDPVGMAVQPLTRLAVSAFFRSNSSVQVGHLVASETNYLAPGDHAAEAAMAGAVPTTSGFWLAGLTAVGGPSPGGVVVCLGDSITDGLDSSVDGEHRYPNRLAERLLAATRGRIGAIDAGIAGNRMLAGDSGTIVGVSALARLSRDALSRAGVRSIILFEGINDIMFPPDGDDVVPELIAAYGQVIAQAHEAGVKVFGATLTPFAGAGPLYYSPAKEAQRQRVNAWIRTSGAFDYMLDFDAVVRSPGDVPRIRAIYDGGDHLHLNDAGYAALADAIPIGVLLRGN